MTSPDADNVDADLADASSQDASPFDAAEDATWVDDAAEDALSPDAETLVDAGAEHDGQVDVVDDYACGKLDVSGTTLLDVGHVGDVRVSGDRLLSSGRGHWVLWDMATRRQLASGESGGDPVRLEYGSAALVGTTLVILRYDGTVEVRDAGDGHLRSSFSTAGDHYPAVPRLALQGNYVWTQSGALRAWSLSGAPLFEHPGDYFFADVFGAADELLIGHGPAGRQMIERVSLAGVASVSAPFTGEFSAWFTDGTRFLTLLDSVVRVYSLNGVEERSVSLTPPQPDKVGGYGEYFWVSEFVDPYALTVRRVDTGATVATLPTEVDSGPIASGGAVALSYLDGTFKIVDLRGRSPAVSEHSAAGLYMEAFATDPSGNWAMVRDWQRLYAGRGAATLQPELFGCGSVLSISGTPMGRTAIATADGYVRVFDLEGSTFRRVARLPLPVTDVHLSHDGSMLIARAWPGDFPTQPDRSVRAFSLPEGTLVHEWPEAVTDPVHPAFSVGRGTPRIAFYSCQHDDARGADDCALQVSDLQGVPTMPEIRVTSTYGYSRGLVTFAPSAARLAWQFQFTPPRTALYDSAGPLGTIEGALAGWLDDERVFVDRYREFRGDYLYTDTVVSDLAGAPLTAPFLAGGEVRMIDSESFYSPGANRVYSTADWQVHWQGSPPVGPRGDVAGSHVVYPATLHSVVFEPWR